MKKATKAFAAVLSVAMFAGVVMTTACTPVETQIDEYAVTLSYNDGISRPRIAYVEKESSLSTPAVPTREGYQIAKWTDAETGGNEITFPYTPKGDVTIYAQWEAKDCTVTFDYCMSGTENKVIKKKYDHQVTKAEVDAIQIPAYSGYNFRHWATKADSGVGVNWENGYTVRKDVTFYACWIADDISIYNLKFNVNYEGAPDGGVIHSMEVVEGDSITINDIPEDPERDGQVFVGWSLNPAAASKDETIEYPYSPTAEQANADKEIILYAVWEKKGNTVRYYYNYEGNPTQITDNGLYLRQNAITDVEVDAPEAITRVQDGVEFTFDGWYTAAVGGTKIEFPHAFSKSTSLYAQWKAPRIETKIFDAEFTPIDPTAKYPGYSNSVMGTECIQQDSGQKSTSQTYPILNGTEHTGHYVYCLYSYGATITYNIYSDKAVDNVDLYAMLSVEMRNEIDMTPEGEYGFSFIVNGKAIDYGSIYIDGGDSVQSGGNYMGAFEEYYIGSVSLQAGDNVILLRVNNANSIGGVTEAWAPMIDYIRFDTSATLSWIPEYDNLYRKN